MGKSLSLDIRERVVLLVEGGYSCHEASRRLRISVASAVRIMQRKRRTGSVAAALFEGHGIRATPAMLSRHLIHRLGFTYKKIPDRNGKASSESPARAIRVEAQTSTKDAS